MGSRFCRKPGRRTQRNWRLWDGLVETFPETRRSAFALSPLSGKLALKIVPRGRVKSWMLYDIAIDGGADVDINMDIDVGIHIDVGSGVDVDIDIDIDVDIDVDIDIGIDVGIDVDVDCSIEFGVDIDVITDFVTDIDVDVSVGIVLKILLLVLALVTIPMLVLEFVMLDHDMLMYFYFQVPLGDPGIKTSPITISVGYFEVSVFVHLYNTGY